MLDRSRTTIAKFVVQYLAGAGPLLVAAWFWLAAEADDLTEKRLCLEAILRLDPENEAAPLALLLVDQRRRTSWTPMHDGLRATSCPCYNPCKAPLRRFRIS